MRPERESRPEANRTASISTAIKTEASVTPTIEHDRFCCLSLDFSDLATCARFGITCESSCARDLLAVSR